MSTKTKLKMKFVRVILREYYNYFLSEIHEDHAYGNRMEEDEHQYAMECTMSTLKSFRRYAAADGIKSPTTYQSVLNYVKFHKNRITQPKLASMSEDQILQMYIG